MNDNKEEKEMKKTKVFNVVILDRSGSMTSIRRAALEGFNETLASIKKAQEKHADTQEHYVSLVTFCGCETKHAFDKTPIADTHPLTMDDYEPCCTTPLYDAMGFTLTDMHNYIKDMDDRIVAVTIITDGLENASKEYTADVLKKLIKKLRSEGWTFTYMGANQDSMMEAGKIAIRNSRDFDYSDAGVCAAYCGWSAERESFYDKVANFKHNFAVSYRGMSKEERFKHYSEMADEAFDEEEKRNKKKL